MDIRFRAVLETELLGFIFKRCFPDRATSLLLSLFDFGNHSFDIMLYHRDSYGINNSKEHESNEVH